MRLGFNLTAFDYYTQARPCLDEMKHSQSWSPTTYTGADGWVSGVPNSTTLDKNIFVKTVEHATHEAVYRLGDYILREYIPSSWTLSILSGTGLVVSGTQNGVQYGSLGGGRFRFKVTALPDAITLRAVSPGSGGPHALVNGDVEIVYEAYESLLDAGEIFAPEYVDNVKGIGFVKEVRAMDVMSANAMGFTGAFTPAEIAVTDFRQESDCRWGPGGDAIGCPPEYSARVAKKIGATHLALNFPTKCTAACRQAWFERSEAVGFTGIYAISDNNEVWNTGFSNTRAALVSFFDANSLTAYDDNGDVVAVPADNHKIPAAYAHKCLLTWKAATDAGIARSRVIRVVEGQAAQFGSAGLMARILRYIDPGIISAGSRLHEVMVSGGAGEVRIAPYWFLNETATFTSVTQKWLIENKAYNFSDAAWKESALSYIDSDTSAQVASYVASVLAVNHSLTVGSYEGGKHAHSSFSFETIGGSYTFTVNQVANALDSIGGVSIAAAFETGEIVRSWGDGYGSSQIANGVNAYVGVVSSTRIKIYPTEEDAEFDTSAYTLDGAEATTRRIDNYTRLVALNEKYRTLINGTVGRDVQERDHEDVYEANGLTVTNYYNDMGSWGYGSVANWGMKKFLSDDNPTYAWYRELGSSDGLGGVAWKRRKKKVRDFDEEDIRVAALAAVAVLALQ